MDKFRNVTIKMELNDKETVKEYNSLLFFYNLALYNLYILGVYVPLEVCECCFITKGVS